MQWVLKGHGKLGKLWNFTIMFSRPGKSWNLSVGHGKSWKMTKNDFSKNNKARNTSNGCLFSHYFENNFSILGHGKGHGKS